jgi:hypothetical protein
VAGIEVRIANVEYSSTSTVIHLELVHPTFEQSRIGYFFFFAPSDIKLSGFADEFPITRTIRRGVDHVDRREFRVGEVLDPTEPVGLVIERLCLLRDGITPACDYQDGPWVFEWIPGSASVDPVDRRLELRQSKEVAGVTVTLDEIRLSSNEMLITARFISAMNPSETVLPGTLSMIQGGGKDLPAEGGGGGTEDVPGLLKWYRFPVPDASVDEVTIRVEIEPGTNGPSGEVTFVVPIPR